MADPTFSQPERRSFLVPILVAIVALALATAIAIHFFPATTVNIDQVRTEVVDTHTAFKSKSIVVGPAPTEDLLFIVETLKVDNQLRLAISLDDFSLDLTDKDGKQLTLRAIQNKDIENIETSFPQLQPLLTTPLARDTNIEPGHSAQGTILFSLQVAKEIWDTRRSGVVKVDLYHQPSLYLTIPK